MTEAEARRRLPVGTLLVHGYKNTHPRVHLVYNHTEQALCLLSFFAVDSDMAVFSDKNLEETTNPADAERVAREHVNDIEYIFEHDHQSFRTDERNRNYYSQTLSYPTALDFLEDNKLTPINQLPKIDNLYSYDYTLRIMERLFTTRHILPQIQLPSGGL